MKKLEESIRGEKIMAKDSQIDKKAVREAKANGQTTLAEENQNQNSNHKKQSAQRGL